MALTAEQFGKALVASGLMSADELRSLWAELPAAERPKDGESFATVLLNRKRLNEFQAKELLSGSGTPLVLNQYVLISKIGAGGMGQVFKAHHRRMDRLAAIKLLPSSLTEDEATVKRFEREVKAAAKLTHPNIVQTFDADECRGIHFMVMEYVEGKDLSAIVKERGTLPVAEAVDCILQAARGLAYAHSKGVVHRDIKPANLLLDNEGVVKILDMGLARFDSSGDAADHQLTNTGAVMGTVDYMAPEQAQDTHAADARSDLYSLGCSLFRLLTGESVYQGDTVVKKIFAHAGDPIPSLCARRPECPAEIDRIFRKMVAKRPDDRYQQAAQLVAELEAWRTPGATASFSGSAFTQQDANLNDFLRSVGGPKPVSAPSGASSAAVKTATKHTAIDAPEQTAAYSGPELQTDPKSEIVPSLVTSAKPSPTATKPKGSGSRRQPPSTKLIAAGAAGFLLLLLGVIVIVRNKDGKEVARLEVPEGHSVVVQPNTPNTTATPRTDTSIAAAVIPAQGAAPALAVAPFDAAQAKAHQAAWAKHLRTAVVKPNSVGMQMTLIPPGEFLMGSSDAEIALALKIAEETKLDSGGVNRIQEERPQHRVRITQPFRLAAHEVTIGQFAKFVEQAKYKTQAEEFGGDSATIKPEEVKPYSLKLNWRTPGPAVTDDSPVTQISWNDTVAFCNWMSGQEQLTPCYLRDGDSWTLLPKGNGYRLPTEAEWEYACRAGSTTQFWFGDDWKEHDKYGWTSKNAGGRPQAVGSLAANPFGMYDMHGNVWEWCHDWYDGKWYEKSPSDDPLGPSRASNRVSRGGSWNFMSAHSRSSYRSINIPSNRHSDRGFRPVLSSVGAQSSAASITPSTPPVVTPSTVANPIAPANADPNAPPLLDCTGPGGADAKTVRESQVAWAKYLGEPSHEKTMYLDKDKKVAIEMVLVPPGKYWRGSPDDVGEESERPQVVITLDQPRWVGKYEITQRQYEAVLGKNPSTDKKEGDDAAKYPVENVSHVNSMDFATQATTATGTKFRLLTEAEWEYACRAGTRTKWYHGDDEKSLGEIAEFDGKNKSPAKVGGKKPNAFGLHDVSGNVWEWCLDWFAPNYDNTSTTNPQGAASGSIRVHRGGSWLNAADHCRSAYRRGHAPDYRPYSLGFRVTADASVAKGVAEAPPLAVAAFDSAQAKAHQQAWAEHLGIEVETPNSVGHKMVLIPPGEFLMGSTDEQVEAALKIAKELNLDEATQDRIRTEKPRRRTVISRPFLIGDTEVTVGEFKKFAAAINYSNPSSNKRSFSDPGFAVTDSSPVTWITWSDSVLFCNWLSEQEQLDRCYRQGGKGEWQFDPTAKGYRLPTDAEWEFACRGGTHTQFAFGDDPKLLDRFGWYNDNSYRAAHSVRQKQANPFGLFDMHGNVEEWCHDWFSDISRSDATDPTGPTVGTSRILRGGSFAHDLQKCRSAARCDLSPNARAIDFGFRVARTVADSANRATVARAAPTASSIFFRHDPAFSQWVEDVRSMSAEKQIEAVSNKLMELNPGFHGRFDGIDGQASPKVTNGVVVELDFDIDRIRDVSPVFALSNLATLKCRGTVGKADFNDLSPLVGMQLAALSCSNAKLTDLSPLRGMPLQQLFVGNTNVTDLTPLHGCPELTYLYAKSTRVTAAQVAALQKALPNCKVEWDDPAKATTRPPASSDTK